MIVLFFYGMFFGSQKFRRKNTFIKKFLRTQIFKRRGKIEMSQKFERAWNALVIVLQSIASENIDEVWPYVARIFEAKYECALLKLPLCEPGQFFKNGKTEGREEDLYKLALDIRHFVTLCRKREQDSPKKVVMSVDVLARLTRAVYCLDPKFKETMVNQMLEELSAEDNDESDEEEMILMENPHYVEFYTHVLQLP